MNLSARAVYTIIQSARLRAAAVKIGRLGFHEGRAWTGAAKLLGPARENGTRIPILLADTEDTSRLTHWAILDRVTINDGETDYQFSQLRELDPPQS